MLSTGPFLFADHIAQDAAEQSNVFDQGAFIVPGLANGGFSSLFHGVHVAL